MNADERYYMMLDEIVALKNENKLLQAELAASQRRERAAVEDMHKVLAEGGYGCDYCKHESNQAACAKTCSSETKLGGWEWRGEQEGERNE